MNGSVASPAGTTRPMRASGTKTVVEDRVVALGRAHAEGVPRLHDGDARAGALDEGVHDLRTAGSVGIHGMGSEPRPRRSVGAELLAAGQAVAALDPFSPARRQEDRDVVARLGVSGGEHLAGEGGVEDPAQRAVAGPVELGRRCRPSTCACSSPAPSPGRSERDGVGWPPSGQGRGPIRRGAPARRRPGSRARGVRPGLRGSRRWSVELAGPGVGSLPAVRSAAR